MSHFFYLYLWSLCFLQLLNSPSYCNSAVVEEWDLPVLPPDSAFPPTPPTPASSSPASTEGGNSPKKNIPRILWMAVRSEEDKETIAHPPHLKNLFSRNKGWDIRMVSNKEKDEFMNKTFAGTSLLWAYHAINPICGAAKADLWRYAALYVHGGVYIDDDSDMSVPLDDVVRPTDQLVVSFEKNGFNGNRCFVPRAPLSDFNTFEQHVKNMSIIPSDVQKDFQFVILNWAIMSAPRHLVMAHVLHRLVQVIRNEYLHTPYMRMLNNEYGWAQIMCATGPSLFTASMRDYVFDYYLHKGGGAGGGGGSGSPYTPSSLAAHPRPPPTTPPKTLPKNPPRRSTFDNGGITPHLPPIADVTAVERKYGSMRQSYRMAHQDFKEYGGRFKAPGTKGPRGNPGHYMHAMRHRGGERKTVSLLSTYTPPLTSIPPEELRGLQGHAMQGQNGKQIFFIDQGQRRGINNYDTFMALNFSMSMVHIVDDGLLALTPLGPPMPYLDYVAPKGWG